MQTPDITPAEWKVTVGALSSVLTILFKFNISDTTQAALTAVIVSVWALALLIGNAVIRNGRSRVAAALAIQPALDGTPGHTTETTPAPPSDVQRAVTGV